MDKTKKINLFFKRLNKRDKILTICSALCLVIGIIIGINMLINRFTIVIPANGGTIKYGVWEQPRFINPVLSQNNDTDTDLIELVFDGLISLSDNKTFTNDLATQITVSKDEKMYEAQLKDNIVWHDGEPFTSNDVVFTIEMIQDPKNESPLYNIWKNVRIEQVGDYIVRFYLEQPQNNFKQNLTLKILPKHIWANINPRQYLMTEYNLKPIGTGPYKYKKLVKDKTGKIVNIYLEKNQKYFKHTPYINEIIVNFYDDQETAFKALLKGKINLIKEVSYYQKELLRTRKTIVLSQLYLPRYYAVFFNQKNPLFQTPKLMEALDMALNKNKIIQDSLYGEAESLNAIISKQFLGYDSKINKNIYNLAQAKDILANLGYKDADNDKFLEKTIVSGKGKNQKTSTEKLEFTLLVPSINELIQLAQNIKQNWETIGIKINLNIIPLQNIYKDYLKTRNFDAILFGEAYGLTPDLYLFWHSSQITDPGLNIASFSDTNVNKLLEENLSIKDTTIIKNNLITIQKILLTKRPLITLCNPYFLYAKDQNIKGNTINIVNTPSEKFTNIEDWYIYTKRVFK